MITVNNINGAPETTPESFFAVHSDDLHFYFFESEAEQQQFLNSIPTVWNESAFIAQLSAAFDAKFETYWKAKGYTDLNDLNSHAANTNSVYNTEALSLIQWSHDEWEAAIADIEEQSNIEEIINGLESYE